jgi:hypothetical protein
MGFGTHCRAMSFGAAAPRRAPNPRRVYQSGNDKKDLGAMGFEPTQLALLVPETNALTTRPHAHCKSNSSLETGMYINQLPELKN